MPLFKETNKIVALILIKMNEKYLINHMINSIKMKRKTYADFC